MKTKFLISVILSLAWIFISYLIAIPWISDVSNVIGPIIAYILISGIAFIPAFGVSFVYFSLLTHDRNKNTALESYPPVTILIAAYNEEDCILNTLNSIENQNYKGELEIIICDDGSKDNTANITKNFIKNSPKYNYKIISSKINQGKSEVLNLGLKESSFDYIITIDADTEVHTNALNSIVETLINTNSIAVAGSVLISNASKNIMTRIQEWDYILGISSVKRAQSAYNATLVAQGAFSIYRKDKLIEVGGWPKTVGEDIVLTWNLLKKDYKVYHDTEAIVFTKAPEHYKQFFNQRKRWSRGLIEAFKNASVMLIKPKMILPFIWYNLSFLFIDVCFLFVFVPSVILSVFFGYHLLVGWLSIFLIPMGIMLNIIIYIIQRRTLKRNGIKLGNIFGLIMFIFFYQLILTPATIAGYFAEILKLNKTWGTK